METGSPFADDSFANPAVNTEIVTSVISYFGTYEQAHPWDAICAVAEEQSIPKKTVRKAVRKLRMQNKLVPAPPFTGCIELADELK